MNRKLMLRLMFLVATFLAFQVGCMAVSEDVWEKPVTIVLHDTPLSTALEDLSKKVGIKFILDPSARDIVVSDYRITDRALFQALDGLLHSCGTVRREEDGKVIVSVKPPSGNWDKPVDLEVKDVPLTDALEMLFKGTGISYTVDASIAGLRVSAVLKNIPFQVALKSVLKAAGAVYRVDGDVVMISPKQVPTSQMNDLQAAAPAIPQDAVMLALGTTTQTAEDVWKKPVTLEVKQMQLLDVLNQLFLGTSISLAVGPEIEEVNVPAFSVQDTPLRDALNSLMRLTGTRYLLLDDNKVSVSVADRYWRKPVDLEIKDASVAEVLQILFRETGGSYTVDPSIRGLKVSTALKNISFAIALKLVTKAAGVTYRIDGDVVMISPKPVPMSQMNEAQAAAPVADANQRQVSQVLNFRNVNAGDVASILAKPGLQVATTSNSQAIVTGPEYAVNEAASLASALDQKSPDKASARPITLKTQLEFKRPIKGNVRFADDLVSPIISTFDGQEARLKLSREFPSNSSKKTSNFVSLSLTPTIRRDGRINISGALDYDMDGYFIRDAKIAATLEPGRPQKQPTINIPSNDGKSKATMDLTLTATLGVQAASPR